MELPKISKSDRGVLSGIKSKLGFADEADARGYDDGYYDDGYGDDYAGEYADDGYDGGYDDGYGNGYGGYDDGRGYADDPAASRYEPYNSVSTRPARGGRPDATTPKLVSIDDVRAHTQVPDSLQRDPLPPRRTSSVQTASSLRAGSYRSDRTMVDGSLPAPGSPRSAAAPHRERSEGFNSLFTPTTDAAEQPPASGRASGSAGAGASAAQASQGGAFDPYEAYAGSGAATHAPTRSLTVLKPVTYAEVERVAKSLRAGDAVVLCLRNTPDHLAKRILDFSFGAASMADARVDCITDKVFAVSCGAGLSDGEKMSLRNQGVL